METLVEVIKNAVGNFLGSLLFAKLTGSGETSGESRKSSFIELEIRMKPLNIRLKRWSEKE
ncbi:hypothetical protein [Halomonas sp. M4R1S46]|uniref:hypothetical protein n=1 Tax=Halomonas sp. M4R1S46 TaxID=2982692 RepID=UPI0021E4449A|nr:hypothetical protein [Halomonas sp. M4R1S46]UYG06833.1 hypothetical protein OCT48_14550 [Halomonas sp. M4R1S46]